MTCARAMLNDWKQKRQKHHCRWQARITFIYLTGWMERRKQEGTFSESFPPNDMKARMAVTITPLLFGSLSSAIQNNTRIDSKLNKAFPASSSEIVNENSHSQAYSFRMSSFVALIVLSRLDWQLNIKLLKFYFRRCLCQLAGAKTQVRMFQVDCLNVSTLPRIQTSRSLPSFFLLSPKIKSFNSSRKLYFQQWDSIAFLILRRLNQIHINPIQLFFFWRATRISELVTQVAPPQYFVAEAIL